MTGKTYHEGLTQSVQNNNTLSGFGYDMAGNMTSNGSTTYQYDAENHFTKFITTSTDIYYYDGDGRRVKKNTDTVTLYWYDRSGNVIDETTSTGALRSEYIYFNGKRMARRDSDNSVKYYFSDHLGSASVITDAVGTMTPHPLAESDYYPYGGEIPIWTGDSNHYKFTGKERDSESGLDNFTARYFGSSLGRFMSPDPMGGHVEDPQTLNRYAYVRNNPLSLTDPTGLDFYLSCQHTDSNGSTCQQMQVGTDKNGNAQMAWVQGQTGDNGFTATQIGNDANGNLVDRTTGTGTYTADVTGSGVQLSNNGGATSATGVFLNKDVDLSGTNQVQSYDTVVRAGNLPGFLFTFQNSKLEASQTAAGFFTAGGTALDVDRALQAAGFKYTMFGGVHYGSNEYRSPGDPSGHFIVNPTIQEPIAGVPQTRGTMHFGETNPASDFWKHVGQWWQ